MVKTTVFVIVFAILFAYPPSVQAAGIGGQSALLLSRLSVDLPESTSSSQINYNLKKKVIKKVLERYNSPMADAADAFIDTCQNYDLDCYLLPSIAGLESYFGRYLLPDSYNAFGWARGLMYFDSWDESIDTVGLGLRENYINRGAESVEEIGAIYCENPTWAARVRSIMKTFYEEEAKHGLYFVRNAVDL